MTMTVTKWDRIKQCTGDSINLNKSDIVDVIPRTNTCADGTCQEGAKIILKNKQEIPVAETVNEVKKALASPDDPQRTQTQTDTHSRSDTKIGEYSG